MTILRRVTDLTYRFATEHGEYPTHVLMTHTHYDLMRIELKKVMMRSIAHPPTTLTAEELEEHLSPKINGLPIWFIEDGKPLAVALVVGEGK